MRREYLSQLDAGRAFGTALKLAMAAGLGVDVDQDALVSGPEMEHFARMHMGALVGGKNLAAVGRRQGVRCPYTEGPGRIGHYMWGGRS